MLLVPRVLRVLAVLAVTTIVASGCSVADLGATDDSSAGSGIADQVEGNDLAGATVGSTTQTDEGSPVSADPAGDAMSDDAMSDDAMSDDAMSDDAMSGDAMSDDAMSDDAMSDGDVGDGETGDDEESVPPSAADLAAAERQLSTDPSIVYRVGSCFVSRSAGAAPVEVPCAEPHTIEVYAVDKLPGGAGSPFLGRDEAVALCNEDFLAATGTSIDLATVFQRSVLRPSEETWLAGERDVTCYVAYPEATTEPLTAIDPLRSFGKVSLYGLRGGDCLIDFTDSESSFNLVDCSEPHDAEVFAESVFDIDVYPGDEAVAAIADELCFGQSFENFVGTAHATSTVRALRSKPNQSTWALGDRTINCLLTDGLVRTGSFEGSEL